MGDQAQRVEKAGSIGLGRKRIHIASSAEGFPVFRVTILQSINT
jgi:hypothetical protein